MMARSHLAWCLFVASSARGAAGAATELFVAPAHGQSGDSALARDGRTRATAFTALHHARDLIRGLPPAQRCRGVTVTVLGGDYSVANGAGALHLDERDSGCPGRPIVYRGLPDGGGRALLHAGVSVPASAFHPVTVDGVAMLRADARPFGVHTFGTFTNAATNGQCVMEQRSSLYHGRQPQTLARHPNIDRATGNFR